MSILLHGDCLDEMKGMDNDSVDFIFCDLPYGQTSCKWDVIVPWEPFWKEIMRVKKLNTPVFFTTTTKFGVELINSAPKKMPFRYDLVWVKSAPAGFLCAKKMPMRKHEMIYVFYEKLPLYDLSSHSHKFIKESVNKRHGQDGVDNKGMIKNRSKTEIQNKYDPPLPTSVVNNIIDGDTYNTKERKKPITREPAGKYNPPLPTSVVKEHKWVKGATDIYGGAPTEDSKECGGHQQRYDPPLPNSLLEIKSTRGKHSTEKPIALMEWLLKYYSKEGDVVLDPTMGSGSTGVACKNMNRNFIGIEKDPQIYEVAVNRIEN